MNDASNAVNPAGRSLVDQVEATLEDRGRRLRLRLSGPDRPGIIAAFTEELDRRKLYVSAMTYALGLPEADAGTVPYQCSILAAGGPAELAALEAWIASHPGWTAAASVGEGAAVPDWTTACLFHVGLHTPDRPGLTARLTEMVGRARELQGRVVAGNVIHLLANTLNSDGPQGSTPYFQLRMTVAAPDTVTRDKVVGDLQTWAVREGMESDLWVRDLNR